MDAEKKLYEVQIGGLPLKLRSSHDEETVNTLVSLVDKKISEAMNGAQGVPFQSALLLSALHIAEELVLLRRAADLQLEQLETKTKGLLQQLENSPLTRLRLDN